MRACSRIVPRIRRAALALLIAGAGLAPAPAAADSDVQIDEVMAGAFGRPEIQFVELQLDDGNSCFDVQWTGRARLAFMDATDRRVGEFVFPGEPPQCSFGPTSLLIATPAFAALPGVPQPDFVMPPGLVPGSGKVCFEAPWREPLCLTYGGFTGDSQQSSPGNAPPLPAEGICALQRVTPAQFFGESFNADFDLAAPAPRNLSGAFGTVNVPPRFNDVPASNPFQPFVEALFNAGVSGGCGNGAFCPGALVTRDQMAVFLLLASEGPGFQPPACTSQVFNDVPCSHPFAAWINELAARGVTGGCGGGNYCPGQAVSRQQMAVFLLVAREGAGFSPPACTSQAFSDVPCSSPFAPWINEIAARGITGGCGNGAFCPGSVVTRDQMAVFLSAAFGLPVPFRGCRTQPIADDHGDFPATATPVVPVSAAPGLPIEGELERPRDVDVFAFAALAGQTFVITPEPQTGFTPAVRVLRSNGLVLADIDGDEFAFPDPTFLVFTAPFNGTFFLQVRDRDEHFVGPYRVFLRSIVDDHPGSGGQPTPLPGTGTVPGEIGVPGDVDVFSFQGTAGQIAALDVTTEGFLTLAVEVFGPTGQGVMFTEVQGAFSPNFLLPATGTYRVEVHADGFGFDPDIGTYRLGIRLRADDHGDTLATATPVTDGVRVDGNLVQGDVDAFRFDAPAGGMYFLTLSGTDNQLEVVRASDGEVIETLDSFFFDKTLSFTTPTAGTYLLRVSPNFLFDPFSLDYHLTLNGPIVDDHGDIPAAATPLTVGGAPVAGRIALPGDVDVFSFPATAGQILFAELSDASGVFLTLLNPAGNPIGSSSTLRQQLIAPSTGTFFVRVQGFSSNTLGAYRIQIRGPVVDDHGGNAAEAFPLDLNAPAVTAGIDFINDTDMFSFEGTAGELFLVKAAAQGFHAIHLDVLDTDGTTVLASDPPSFFEDSVGVVLLQAPSDGTFFARVSGEVGEYQISVRGPIHDEGGTPATATLLTVDAPPTPGEIHYFGDLDAFAFDAAEGQSLIIETGDLSPGFDTVLEIFTPDGSLLLASDDDGAGNLASRVDFTAPAAGRYIARVRSFAFLLGTYTIAVRTP